MAYIWKWFRDWYETRFPKLDGEDARQVRDKNSFLMGVYAAIFIGIVVVICCDWRNAATPLLWALACLASAGLVGFLFGIPKILQEGEVTKRKRQPAGSTDTGFYRQQVNTNLEHISDWLTKIIVGMGLIELRNVPGYLDSLAERLARDMGSPTARFPAGALIVYFLVFGFVYGYLETRLFLAPAFRRADKAALEELHEAYGTGERERAAGNGHSSPELVPADSPRADKNPVPKAESGLHA